MFNLEMSKDIYSKLVKLIHIPLGIICLRNSWKPIPKIGVDKFKNINAKIDTRADLEAVSKIKRAITELKIIVKIIL